MSSADWDAAKGPTANADSSRMVPVTPLTTTAYTGQWRNRPLQPSWASTSVAALTKAASMAHTRAAAAPSSAARRAGRTPTAEDQEDHDDQAPAPEGHDPTLGRGVAVSFAGIGRHQEPDEAGTQQGGGTPGPGGDAVVEPEGPQGQREDELGDQDGLHRGQLTEVESQRGEHEGSTHAHHAQQPHGLADQEQGGLPDRPLLVGPGDVGQTLEHGGERLAERTEEGEQDAHRS